MSETAAIRRAIAAGDPAEAGRLTAALLSTVLGRPVVDVHINSDVYSLNSVNGFADLADGCPVFFKFHQEDGEEAGVAEYYNAQVLDAAGYPVDRPLAASQAPGRQVLVYRRRDDRRLSDVCADLERTPDPALQARVVAAQTALDDTNATIALDTLHAARREAIAAEPIHQLFHRRLADPDAPGTLGARAKSFYVDGRFDFDRWSGDWAAIADLTWRIDGRDYPVTLRQAFTRALSRLNPARLGPGTAVTAHGDAHNANVWFQTDAADDRLVLFDPAFAGRHIPVLLADVKATFHNIFAHPFWLYDPAEATQRHHATVRRVGDALEVETDWTLSPLRRTFLEIKARRFWHPLLTRLKADGALPPDWEQTVRAALFACPTLVMDLTAAGRSAHTTTSSAIGLAVAIQCSQVPAAGDDAVSTFFALCRHG